MKTLPSLITRILAIVAITILAFSACKKEDESATDSAKEEFASASAETDATADVVFDDLFDNIMGVNTEVGIGGTGVFGRANMSNPNGGRVDGVDSVACYIVTAKQINGSSRFPLQVTIDFGAGCTSSDGRTRAGKVTIVYTGKMTTTGSSATASFDNYSIDNIKVQGSQRITNSSTQDKKSYTSVVTNAKLTWSNGNYSEWSSEKTVAQTDGNNTPLVAADDIFTLSGQASGSIQKGDKYFQWSTTITSPITKKYICHYFSKGSLSLSKAGTEVAVLDYGSGACDRKATFSVNGVVHEITLH